MATEDEVGRPSAKCPVCDLICNAAPGQQTPPHRDQDRKPCPGGVAVEW